MFLESQCMHRYVYALRVASSGINNEISRKLVNSAVIILCWHTNYMLRGGHTPRPPRGTGGSALRLRRPPTDHPAKSESVGPYRNRSARNGFISLVPRSNNGGFIVSTLLIWPQCKQDHFYCGFFKMHNRLLYTLYRNVL